MYGYIYLTTNLINNKKYIGQHRSTEFDPKYKGSGKLILEAFNKYGFENFNCEILKECFNEEDLNLSEKQFIENFKAVESNEYYNLAEGGLGHTCEPWNKGKHQELHPNSAKGLDYGRHLPASEKLKNKLHNRKELVEYTQEYRNKLSKQQKLNRTVNDGERNYIIKVYELDEYLSKGYKRGRVKTGRFND